VQASGTHHMTSIGASEGGVKDEYTKRNTSRSSPYDSESDGDLVRFRSGGNQKGKFIGGVLKAGLSAVGGMGGLLAVRKL